MRMLEMVGLCGERVVGRERGELEAWRSLGGKGVGWGHRG